MSQNRNKLIGLMIGNLANAIVHKILENAITDENIRNHYNKELEISINKASEYRKKINPINAALQEKDIEYIKQKITKKVNLELSARISKGYTHINLNLVDKTVTEALERIKIM